MVRVAPSLAASGAVLGPVLDNFHGQAGVLVYDAYQLRLGEVFQSATWVPPLFGVAAVLIGGIALGLDEVFVDLRPNRWLPTLAATIIFAVQYWLSAELGRSGVGIAILWAVGGGIWATFDPRPATLVTSIATALGGPAVEIILTGGAGAFPEPFGHLYHYTSPDFYGVESWIPAVYFGGATPVAMLARCFLQKVP